MKIKESSEGEILTVISVSVLMRAIFSLTFNSGDILFWEKEVGVRQNAMVTKTEVREQKASRDSASFKTPDAAAVRSGSDPKSFSLDYFKMLFSLSLWFPQSNNDLSRYRLNFTSHEVWVA